MKSPPEARRGDQTSEERDDNFGRLVNNAGHRWRTELAERLIPEDLRSALAEGRIPELVLVPSSALWGLPFGALLIEGDPLIERATISLIPSLALCRQAPVDPDPDGALAYFYEVVGTDIELRALNQLFDGLEVPPNPDALEAVLADAERFLLGVISVHGDGAPGLAHALKIGPDRFLSAARLLGAKLPAALAVGACFSASLSFEPGGEPIGIPTVALIRGARGVLGALFDVEGTPTGRLLARTYAEVAEGVPLASALRTAQVDWLRTHPTTSPADWAGLVVIGGLGPGQPGRAAWSSGRDRGTKS